jgi:hypothetical protein
MASRPITAEDLRRISTQGALKMQNQKAIDEKLCREACFKMMSRTFQNNSLAAAKRGDQTITIGLPPVHLPFLHGGLRCNIDKPTMQLYAGEVAKQVIPGVDVSVNGYCFNDVWGDEWVFKATLEW